GVVPADARRGAGAVRPGRAGVAGGAGPGRRVQLLRPGVRARAGLGAARDPGPGRGRPAGGRLGGVVGYAGGGVAGAGRVAAAAGEGAGRERHGAGGGAVVQPGRGAGGRRAGAVARAAGRGPGPTPGAAARAAVAGITLVALATALSSLAVLAASLVPGKTFG